MIEGVSGFFGVGAVLAAQAWEELVQPWYRESGDRGDLTDHMRMRMRRACGISSGAEFDVRLTLTTSIACLSFVAGLFLPAILLSIPATGTDCFQHTKQARVAPKYLVPDVLTLGISLHS